MPKTSLTHRETNLGVLAANVVMAVSLKSLWKKKQDPMFKLEGEPRASDIEGK